MKPLVIILAETRSHEITWKRFKSLVIDSMNADLAICVGKKPDYDTSQDPFYQHAKYIWEYEELEDYSSAYEYAAREIEAKDCTYWRKMLKIKDQLLGGIKDDSEQHPGAGGLLIFFRWYLLKCLTEDIIEKYDRFIITRSDFFYLFKHVPLELLDEQYIWIPYGEDWGGYTDRHIILNKNDLKYALDLIRRILIDTDQLFEEMKFYDQWNIEQYLKYHMIKSGVSHRVKRYPRSMFTVRGNNDKTRWAYGEFNELLQCYVKYQNEYNDTVNNQLILMNTGGDWKILMDRVV